MATTTLAHPPFASTSSHTPSLLSKPTYRLLYRGALSLPDSFLLLDGLTFSTRLELPVKSAEHLLSNPLALALESMRGRPSLRFMGTVPTQDLVRGTADGWLDESGGVEMEIHPSATLSRIYFENVFCMSLSSSSSFRKELGKFSETGVKIALGDSDGPDKTTEIIVFARPEQCLERTVKLVVACISKQPPASQRRLPRPDDPTPRKPPLLFGRAKRPDPRSSTSITRELKRSTSEIIGIPVLKKQRTIVDLGNQDAAGLGSALRREQGLQDQFHWMSTRKGKERAMPQSHEIGDVFDDRLTMRLPEKVRRDGKPFDEDVSKEEREKMNKNILKKFTMEYLAKTKDPTSCYIEKSHPEFKDLYGFIYRGVGFAMRADMRNRPLQIEIVRKLVVAHAKMYVPSGSLLPNL